MAVTATVPLDDRATAVVVREEAERWEREGPPDLRDIIGGPL